MTDDGSILAGVYVDAVLEHLADKSRPFTPQEEVAIVNHGKTCGRLACRIALEDWDAWVVAATKARRRSLAARIAGESSELR